MARKAGEKNATTHHPPATGLPEKPATSATPRTQTHPRSAPLSHLSQKSAQSRWSLNGTCKRTQRYHTERRVLTESTHMSSLRTCSTSSWVFFSRFTHRSDMRSHLSSETDHRPPQHNTRSPITHTDNRSLLQAAARALDFHQESRLRCHKRLSAPFHQSTKLRGEKA